LRRSGAAFTLLDVRRQVDFDSDDAMIPGAQRADPDLIDEWSAKLRPDEPVIIYCVRGGSVSRSVSASLIERGLNVRFIEGGITAWRTERGAGDETPG
jgi:rhodanese-related sulfurtransferase